MAHPESDLPELIKGVKRTVKQATHPSKFGPESSVSGSLESIKHKTDQSFLRGMHVRQGEGHPATPGAKYEGESKKPHEASKGDGFGEPM